MNSRIIKEMSDREVIDAMQADTPLSKVRKIFYHGNAAIEQALAQRKKPGIIEIRKMELDFANDICKLFGVGLE